MKLERELIFQTSFFKFLLNLKIRQQSIPKPSGIFCKKCRSIQKIEKCKGIISNKSQKIGNSNKKAKQVFENIIDGYGVERRHTQAAMDSFRYP